MEINSDTLLKEFWKLFLLMRAKNQFESNYLKKIINAFLDVSNSRSPKLM